MEKLLPQTYSIVLTNPGIPHLELCSWALTPKRLWGKFTTILLLFCIAVKTYFLRSLLKRKFLRREEIWLSRFLRVVWYKKEENKTYRQLFNLASSYLAHSQNTKKKKNRRLGKQPLVPTKGSGGQQTVIFKFQEHSGNQLSKS